MIGPLRKLLINKKLIPLNRLKFSTRLSKMKVIPIEALSDNYMYLIADEVTNECAAVDPVEPDKVIKLSKLSATFYRTNSNCFSFLIF